MTNYWSTFQKLSVLVYIKIGSYNTTNNEIIDKKKEKEEHFQVTKLWDSCLKVIIKELKT